MEIEYKMDTSSNKESPNEESFEDGAVTMVDVLNEEEQLEKDAAAVLGPGDDTQCSYYLGHMKRQALYSCLTCCPGSEDFAGVCLACSLHCHEDHNLVELYTKRNFKCDCGNSKMPTQKCKLINDKSEVNDLNKYNQNFKGLYCTCAKPYPDPDDTIEDVMIQCCVCEDWYHGRHLGLGSVPEGDCYSEMICKLCVPKLSFLPYYKGLAIIAGEKESPPKSDEKAKDEKLVDVVVSKNVTISLEKKLTSVESNPDDTKSSAITPKPTNSCDNASSNINADMKCKLLEYKKERLPEGSVFLSDKWREQLCQCEKCKSLYKSDGVQFLLDLEDTIAHHEAQSKHSTGVERELNALSTLDRHTRVEVVTEYNNLSSSLRDYLKKFADNGKVVRGEDIKEFFSELEANKKSKTNNGFQYFCK